MTLIIGAVEYASIIWYRPNNPETSTVNTSNARNTFEFHQLKRKVEEISENAQSQRVQP